MKSYIVTEIEMVEHFLYLEDLEQTMLFILKEKGAPIIGPVLLKIDPKYKVTRIDHMFHIEFIFTNLSEQNPDSQ
jgi:hypothetical protein